MPECAWFDLCLTGMRMQVLTEDDREKWREIITTESTLRTLLTEAVVTEDFERIRRDTRFVRMFEPIKWDVIIRVLASPPHPHHADDTSDTQSETTVNSDPPIRRFHRRPDADSRSHRSSLMPVLESLHPPEMDARSITETTVDQTWVSVGFHSSAIPLSNSIHRIPEWWMNCRITTGKRGAIPTIRKSGTTNPTGWVVHRWLAVRRNSPTIRHSGFRMTASPPLVNTPTLHPHAGVDRRGIGQTSSKEATNPAPVYRLHRADVEGSPTNGWIHPADPKPDRVGNRI